MRNSLLIGAALVACAAPAAAQSVKAGVDAWQRADYEAAIEIWLPLAISGHADAAFNLGQAYRLGRGVPIDLAEAQKWLEQAARQNHLDAQATLGLLLFQNGNSAEGLRWLKIAAERGEPRSMLMYGTALFNGDGVERDPVLAYAYVSRAAAQGLAPAKSTLAEMDEILPLEQRRKGVAIALEKATGRPPARTAASPPPVRPASPAARPAAPAAKSAAPAAAAKPPAPRSVPDGGAWRIQLGAFSNRASAEALFRRLSSSAPVAGRRSFLVPAGGVTRLQVGPFTSRAAAASACASLKAKGQACFPVGPG